MSQIISSPFSLSLLITLIMIILNSASSTPSYLYHFCSNDTVFKHKSKYHANLNVVFRSLSSNATNPTGFATASAGTSSNSSAVYGLFLCRGDQNATACQDCVTTAATTDLPRRLCRNRKEAVIWYDECMVRYGNRSISGSLDLFAGQLLFNVHNVTGNLTRFSEVLGKLMDDVTGRAAQGGSSGKKFATEIASYSSLQTLYGLGQCTPDLTTSDCNKCFETAIKYLPLSIGGRTLMPSCNVRYEIYPFFNGAANLSLLSPPPAPSPDGGSTSMSRVHDKKKVSTKVIIAAVVPVAAISAALLITGFCFITRKLKKHNEDSETGEDFTDAESLQYDLATLQSATNYFSHQNKLGEGGFGGVFKGTLNGREIAVKRLSKGSVQGVQEFKNEVLLVAKLQHRNLVRLLGFCVDGEEKLLIYEFVPNKSLDYFLFDPEKRQQLDWGQRYKIIGGIARGMLYLHQDSRVRVVHRDLKASNILLDADMNAKISDFGMARIFGGDETQGNTSKVVGTYGYMSPEYAMHGQFSDKSDVYSFGVLVLEIISGKRNNSFHQQSNAEDLLSSVWKQWRNNTPLEFVDPSLRNSCSIHEVMRCIHLGLLCVQESVDDRPSMATIVLTLDSYSVTLPVPKQQIFVMMGKADQSASSQPISLDHQMSASSSITEVDPR